MRGIGFLESADALPENDSRRAALIAGYLVIGVVEMTFRDHTVDAQAMSYAHRFVLRVTDLTIAYQLRAVLDAVELCDSGEDGWRDAVSARLMGYGAEVQAAGYPAAAADIFGTVARGLTIDVDLRMQAMSRRAFALRLMARYDDAALTYDALRMLAREQGATATELNADLSVGGLLIERGNLPAAEPVVMNVIERATALGEHDVVARALIDRASIAGIQRQPARVLEFCFKALAHVHDAGRRERTLVNMAYAFRELGRSDAAHRIARSVFRSARQADQRLFGGLLLCHLLIDAEDWAAVDDLLRMIAVLPMTPHAHAEYHEVVARGLATRGDRQAAEQALEAMMEVAEHHRLAELTIRAETAMRDVIRGLVPSLYKFRPVKSIPREEQRIVNTVEEEIDSLLVA